MSKRKLHDLLTALGLGQPGSGVTMVSRGKPCNADSDQARASGIRCEGIHDCRRGKGEGFYGVCQRWDRGLDDTDNEDTEDAN
jgi:hypothetical protein